MLTIDEIRDRLKDRKLSTVAEATGIHYNTLRSILRGDNKNPTLRVMSSLSEYLEKNR